MFDFFILFKLFWSILPLAIQFNSKFDKGTSKKINIERLVHHWSIKTHIKIENSTSSDRPSGQIHPSWSLWLGIPHDSSSKRAELIIPDISSCFYWSWSQKVMGSHLNWNNDPNCRIFGARRGRVAIFSIFHCIGAPEGLSFQINWHTLSLKIKTTDPLNEEGVERTGTISTMISICYPLSYPL